MAGDGQGDPAAPDQETPTALKGALAGIARRHEEIRAEKHLDLYVPGFEGLMKVRYHLLPEAEMDRLARRIEDTSRGEKGVAASMEIDADMLVALCDRIFVRNKEDEEYVLLEDGNGPIRFEARLAKILKQVGANLDDRRAKEVAMDLFSPREDSQNPTSPRLQPQAMETHTRAILQWHRGERENISRQLLGE